MKAAVLVNGVPASGKSTVARYLSAGLLCPLLTLDTVKESLFDHLGIGDRDYNRKLGRASYAAIWSLVAEFPAGLPVVVDAWFGFQPLDVLEGHLRRAGVGTTLEVWCHAPPEVLAERYAARVGQRHAGHPGAAYVPELIALAGRAHPLARGPLFSFDSCRRDANDLTALLAWVRSGIRQEGPEQTS